MREKPWTLFCDLRLESKYCPLRYLSKNPPDSYRRGKAKRYSVELVTAAQEFWKSQAWSIKVC